MQPGLFGKRLEIAMSMKIQTMGGGTIVNKILVPFQSPLGKQVSTAKW